MTSVAYDRGSADRYYGRPYLMTAVFDRAVPSKEDLEEYKRGWNEEKDRKDWGDGQYAPQQCDIE
jgi:hypothetical protein